MSKEAAVQPAKGKSKVKATGAVSGGAGKRAPVAARPASPDEAKQNATAAAVEKVSARSRGVSKTVAAKPAGKPVAEPPAPAAGAPARAVKKAPAVAGEKPAPAPKADKPEKTGKAKKPTLKKPKLVRDSFTIPEADYALFATLKQRALSAGIEVKKSEILRAAVSLLARLDDAELTRTIGLVERIKTGRPRK